MFRQRIKDTSYVFGSLAELLAKASPVRAGDRLAGLAAASAEENMAAKLALADVPLKAILAEPLIPYEDDEVTRLIVDTHDAGVCPVSSMTVGEIPRSSAAHETDASALKRLAPGITPEIAAAVSKLMRNQDLVLAARKCRVVTAFRNTIGLARHHVGAPAAEPSDRRSGRHHGLHRRRLDVWRGRCGDRHQPGLRLRPRACATCCRCWTN